MNKDEYMLNINSKLREMKPHGSIEFPCGVYRTVYTESRSDLIPWHWHGEIELVYAEDGEMTLKTPRESFVLKKGDTAVFNSGVLHSGQPMPMCVLRTIVVSPILIAGSADSVFYKRYVEPVISNPELSGCVFSGENRESINALFNEAFDVMQKEKPGYEFIVRDRLSRICFSLFEKYGRSPNSQAAVLDRDSLRVRKMLDFIHENYSQDISLSEISAVSGISQRECLRCFKKTLQISPMQYLIKYRIMQGAELLLSDPGRNVSEVATCCGFDSPSNFTKMFKRYYTLSPREYRALKIC